MCGRVRQAKQIITPHVAAFFNTAQGFKQGPFGIERGYFLNARADRLYTPFWQSKKLERGILSVDSFYEKNREFELFNEISKQLPIPLAIVYSLVQGVNSFAIVTTDARFGVEKYHDRMPAILDNQYEWLHNGNLLIPLQLNLKAA